MKKLIVHIFAIIFLLFLTESKSANVLHSVKHFKSSEKIKTSNNDDQNTIHSRFFKNHKLSSNLYSIHIDESSDISDSENSKTIDILGIVTKSFIFLFLLQNLNTKYVKHFFSYNAFIRLFSNKYIVLRNLRI